MSMHEIARSEQSQLFQVFVTAHSAFESAFCNALQHAKEAGEALLKLQTQTGLKGTPLFDLVREQVEVAVSDRSCYLYLRIASRWNEISVVAGERLNELTLSQAAKLLQQPKPAKPPKKKDEAQPVQPGASDSPKAHSDSPPDLFLTSLFQPDNVAPAAGPPEQDASGGLQPVAAVERLDPSEAGREEHSSMAGAAAVVPDQVEPKADLLTALAQVVFRLEYLCQEVDHVEDASSVLQLTDKAFELIQRLRAKVA